MVLLTLILAYLLTISAEEDIDAGYCNIESKSCPSNGANLNEKKMLFYDVNPPEGFNLRRDVYMRFAIMLSEARKKGKRLDWQLILPPWYNLYHWRNDAHQRAPKPWSAFFDVPSLKLFSPVAELHEVFSNIPSKSLVIDTLYILQNYENAFENGDFRDKWEVSNHPCKYNGNFWGYKNITTTEIVCIKFQGKISMLWDIVTMHRNDKKIMFAHGEIPLHDTYGTKPYWDCRKSMKFNNELANIAFDFKSKILGCDTLKCDNYISIHWRRRDFAQYRTEDVPSIRGTVKQIDNILKHKLPNITKIFIATDASNSEIEKLEMQLDDLNYETYFYLPSKDIMEKHGDGGIAVIEQIICSQSAYFVGTHESTYTFRIQEEREILGFDSSTTFNRLCPDKGICEGPSKWTIIH